MTYSRQSPMPVSADALFAWHERPGAFQRLAPPWQNVELARFEGIREGQRAEIRLGMGPLSLAWTARHTDYKAGRQFVDVQESGPFARWRHTHRFLPDGPEHSLLSDEVDFALPGGPPVQVLGKKKAMREMRRLFAYRHRVTGQDLAAHERLALEPMRIAVTGSTGMIGEALLAFLTSGGHQVTRLVRARSDVIRLSNRPTVRAAFWDPKTGEIDRAALDRQDAVIHLAGENVFAPRWTTAKKRRILQSRVDGTTLLAETLAGLPNPPRVLLSASASGYYGGRAGGVLTEKSPSGTGFLAEVCRAWEKSTAAAETAGIRTVHLRIGVVLSPSGGALGVTLPAFKLGLGGWPGDGQHFMPWIALDDVLYAIHHALGQDDLSGPINLSAPEPVTARELFGTLGKVLRRPVPIRPPAPILEMVLGEAAREFALKSVRMIPERLMEQDFPFAYPDLDGALRHVLGRTDRVPAPGSPLPSEA
jgi:uncharacterized protein (TIGR01777 family)